MRTNRIAKSALAAGAAALLLTSVSTGVLSAPVAPAAGSAVNEAAPNSIIEVGKRGRGYKSGGSKSHKFKGHKYSHKYKRNKYSHKFKHHRHGHGHHHGDDIWPYLAFGLAAGAFSHAYSCDPRYEYCGPYY